MSTPPFESFPPELLPLLQRWRVLTEAERTAIESSEWRSLQDAQDQKERLQAQMDGVLERTGTPLSTTRQPLRFLPPEAAELIQVLKRLEQENRELLGQKLTVVRSGMAQVNTSVRHLRQVHQAYGQNNSGIWESYS